MSLKQAGNSSQIEHERATQFLPTAISIQYLCPGVEKNGEFGNDIPGKFAEIWEDTGET